ncbi:MAG: hypothetical protein H0T46_19265 [Deltaproteobacteria bacterium]|nr:hypothetical protein [Deltaproteobacteria bacterium]
MVPDEDAPPADELEDRTSVKAPSEATAETRAEAQPSNRQERDAAAAEELRVKHHRRGAYHEAGHAAARWAQLGDYCSIELEADGTGFAQGPDSGDIEKFDRARIEAEIRFTIAGPVAEATSAGIPVQFVWYGGAGQADVVKLTDLLDRACAQGWLIDREQEAQRYGAETEELLRQHWPFVVRLAEALLSSGRVSADEMRQLSRAP